MEAERQVSKLSEGLDSGRFLVTCELNPPKGTGLQPLLDKAEMLGGVVDAFNVTDSASSIMAMAPIAAAHMLVDRGLEPIMQVTCRDRNRLALQSEILAAAALGVSNVLCMTGDPPAAGDHPETKAVFDLDGIELVQAANALRSGEDLAGNALKGAPDLFIGAVVNPGAPDLAKELGRMEQKIEAGAAFFQSQAVYDPGSFERFMRAAEGYGKPVMAGHVVLKSARMARNLNDNLPGVTVPDDIIDDLEHAEDRAARSVTISGRIIREIRSMCSGVHVMAIGWERHVPAILEAAGLSSGG